MLKIVYCLEPVTVCVIIFEADALMDVALSKTEKRVPYGVLIGTAECVTL
jgi:hypothetical protein